MTMSELVEPNHRRRQRRADAERSIAAILDAAARVLGERPDASVEDIAEAAGVTRQTVYAHYSSREMLLSAVIDRATAEVVAAMDAAEPDRGPPVAALIRLLDASWQAAERHPFLFHAAPVSPRESPDRHRPVFDRFERVTRRGQRSGDFDRGLSPTWLVTATVALAHAAFEAAATGEMTTEEATDALRRSVLRVFGADQGPAH